MATDYRSPDSPYSIRAGAAGQSAVHLENSIDPVLLKSDAQYAKLSRSPVALFSPHYPEIPSVNIRPDFQPSLTVLSQAQATQWPPTHGSSPWHGPLPYFPTTHTWSTQTTSTCIDSTQLEVGPSTGHYADLYAVGPSSSSLYQHTPSLTPPLPLRSVFWQIDNLPSCAVDTYTPPIGSQLDVSDYGYHANSSDGTYPATDSWTGLYPALWPQGEPENYFALGNDPIAPSSRKCPFPGCDKIVNKATGSQHVRIAHAEFCTRDKTKSVTCPVYDCRAIVQSINFPKHFMTHLGKWECPNGCGAFLSRSTQYDIRRHEKTCKARPQTTSPGRVDHGSPALQQPMNIPVDSTGGPLNRMHTPTLPVGDRAVDGPSASNTIPSPDPQAAAAITLPQLLFSDLTSISHPAADQISPSVPTTASPAIVAGPETQDHAPSRTTTSLATSAETSRVARPTRRVPRSSQQSKIADAAIGTRIKTFSDDDDDDVARVPIRRTARGDLQKTEAQEPTVAADEAVAVPVNYKPVGSPKDSPHIGHHEEVASSLAAPATASTPGATRRSSRLASKASANSVVPEAVSEEVVGTPTRRPKRKNNDIDEPCKRRKVSERTT